MARHHLGLPNPGADMFLPTQLKGETRGALLRHVNAEQTLLGLVEQRVRWPEQHILGIHGSLDPALLKKLRRSGIWHIVVWREEHLGSSSPSAEDLRDFAGTGAMQLVSPAEASVLATDAYAEDPDRIREIFRLDDRWNFDSWSGHHPMFLESRRDQLQ
jgi:hypothetical protein